MKKTKLSYGKNKIVASFATTILLASTLTMPISVLAEETVKTEEVVPETQIEPEAPVSITPATSYQYMYNEKFESYVLSGIAIASGTLDYNLVGGWVTLSVSGFSVLSEGVKSGTFSETLKTMYLSEMTPTTPTYTNFQIIGYPKDPKWYTAQHRILTLQFFDKHGRLYDIASSPLDNEGANPINKELAIMNTQNLVNPLFVNDTPTSNAIKGTTDQKKIDDARAKVAQLPEENKYWKDIFNKDLDTAQTLLNNRNAAAQELVNQAAAEKAVNELFKNNNVTSGEIKDLTNQKAIDDAKALINQVKDAPKKAALEANLKKAQDLLNAKNTAAEEAAKEAARQTAAEKAVNELFKNDKVTSEEIKDLTNQKAIDDAKILINQVKDAPKKAELEADLQKAQDLLDAKTAAVEEAAKEAARQNAAEKAVNELFKNDKVTSGEIKDVTDQKAIDDAKELITQVKDAPKKAELEANLKVAQDLLDAKKAAVEEAAKEAARQNAAEKAVNELFKNDKVTSGEIKDVTDQKAIDDAKELITQVKDAPKKAELEANLKVAQDLLNEKMGSTLTVNDFQLKLDSYLTGVVKGATAIRVTVNGTEYVGGTIKADGSFTFYVRDKVKALTDKVSVTAYNKAGVALVSRSVNITESAIGKGTITANDYQVAVDSNLVGTYTGDVKSVRVFVEGTEYKGGSLNTDGTFRFYLRDKVKNVNQPVVVKGYDVYGNEIATNTVKLKAQVPGVGQIIPTPYVLTTDYYVTGTYKGDVRKIRVFVDGKEYSGGTIYVDGTFKFYARDKIKAATKEVKIIAYDADGKVTGESIIPIVGPEKASGTMTPKDFTVGVDKTITGSFTGDVKKMKVVVDGTEFSGGTISKDGTFSFYAYGKVTISNQTVTVLGFDVQGNQISENPLVLK